MKAFIKDEKLNSGKRWAAYGYNNEYLAGCETMHNRQDADHNAELVFLALAEKFKEKYNVTKIEE